MAEVFESQNEHEGELPFEITYGPMQEFWNSSQEFRQFVLHVCKSQSYEKFRHIMSSDLDFQESLVQAYETFRTTETNFRVFLGEKYARTPDYQI